MKIAMKKFFSIALALVLLIGALPFSASAASESKVKFWTVKEDGGYKQVGAATISGEVRLNDKFVAANCSEFVQGTHKVTWYEGKNMNEAVAIGGNPGLITVPEDEAVMYCVVIEERAAANTGSNNSGSNNSGSNNSGSSNGGLNSYTKFAYPVYLNIYTDTTVGTVKKTVNITEGIAADGLVTLTEVKSVVEYYYNAVDTDKGIQYDGLYPAQGNWVFNYVADQKYERIDGLYEAAAKNYVYINVMITNATAAGTASTNPKTGDAIFAPVAIMAVSASALAVLFFFNKKRAIV